MRWRLTFVLAVLNALLFGVLFLLARWEGTGRPTEGDRLVLPGGTVADLTGAQLFVAEEKEHQWALVRREDGWWVDSPLSWPANPFSVDRLRQQLASLRWENRFPVAELAAAGREVSTFGLAPPQARLVLDLGSKEERLLFGAPTEVGPRVYLLSADGQEVMVVDRSAVSGILVEPDEFLAREVFSLHASTVRALTVERVGAATFRVRLVRDEDDLDWRLVAPLETPADRQAVEEALQRLTTLRVQQFTEPPPPSAPVVLRVSLENARDRQWLSLREVPEEPSLYLATLDDRTPGILVEREAFDMLPNAQETLRRKEIFAFDPAQVTGLTISQGQTETRLQRLETGDWQVLQLGADGGPQSVAAEPSLVSDLITRLAGLRARAFVTDAPSEADLARFGIPDPQRQVRIEVREGGPRELTIGAWQEPGKSVFAKVAGQASIYAVDPDILWDLPLNPLHYRQRVVATLSADKAVRSLAIRSAGGEEVAQVVIGSDGQPEPAASTDASRAAWATLAGFAREVKAREFLATRFQNPYPLDARTSIEWPWRLVVTFEMGEASDKAGEATWFLSRRLGGNTWLMGSPDRDLVFSLPVEVVEALEVLVPAEPGPIDTLRATTPAQTPAAAVEAAPEPAAPAEATAPETGGSS